jgi:hypothetical protein
MLDGIAAFFDAIDRFGQTYLWFLVEKSTWEFLILTVVLAGGAAFLAGRALAQGWKSPWLLAVYMLLFTAGVRFLDFALFEGNLLSLLYYISHGLVLMAMAMLGYRLTRATQMVTQYPWLYDRSGPFGWRSKA